VRYRELLSFLAGATSARADHHGALWRNPRRYAVVSLHSAVTAGLRQTDLPDVILCSPRCCRGSFLRRRCRKPMSLIGNTSLISKNYFPRLIIPLSAVVTAFVDFMIRS
jgi:hypothetical protein